MHIYRLNFCFFVKVQMKKNQEEQALTILLSIQSKFFCVY